MRRQAPFLFPEGAQLGVDNLVLHARATRHRVDNYVGPISIKTVVDGQVAWIVRGRDLVVDRSSFLILAAGERYSMNLDAPAPVETCCVFFAPGFVERVALDSTTSLRRALNQPDRLPPALPYLSALHSDRERSLVRAVHALAPRCQTALAPSGFEEEFLLLASALLEYYERIRIEAARVPAARESTRKELYRRLLVGRDYMHARSSVPPSLAGVARAACLSPYHFHRGFTQVFGKTPHAYLTHLRLAQARELLEAGAAVLEACLAVGFSSPSAFSRLFRSRYGEPPAAVRRKFARSGKNAAAASSTLGA